MGDKERKQKHALFVRLSFIFWLVRLVTVGSAMKATDVCSAADSPSLRNATYKRGRVKKRR